MFRVKTITLVILLITISGLALGQDKSKKQEEWEAAAIARMSEDMRQKYERLRKPDFAKLELLPRLLELNESPEVLFQPYKVSDRIFFRLLVTNTSSYRVAFSVADPYYYNRPQLLRDGESVPYRSGLTELLKEKEKNPAHRSANSTTLAPQETYDDIIELKDWYEPLQPGRYLLTVKRRFIWGGEWIESPSIIFEVTSK